MSRWLLLIALVLVAHLALIFTFGTRKPITPRAVTNVPELELADGSGEWLTLNNPTIFALPNRVSFAGPAWMEPPHLKFHWHEWAAEPARWLHLTNRLPAGQLGTTFSEFMQTNRFATFHFELKPPVRFTEPLVPLMPAFAGSSTLRIEGALAKRPLLTPLKLPSWPFDDLIAPSRIQVLVNASGNVISAVLLPPRNPGEIPDAAADQRALDLARAARFAPASGLTVGQLIFDWRTVAPTATNTPAGS